MNSKKKIFISYDIDDFKGFVSNKYDEIVCLNITTFLFAKNKFKNIKISKYLIDDNTKKNLMKHIITNEKNKKKIKLNFGVNLEYINDIFNYYYNYYYRSKLYYTNLQFIDGDKFSKLKNKIVKLNIFSNLADFLHVKFIDESRALYNLKKLSLIKNYLLIIINKIIFYLLKNKKIVWTTSRDLAFNNFILDNLSYKNYIFIGLNDIANYDKPILRSFKNLLDLIFYNNKTLEIFIPYFYKNNLPNTFLDNEICNENIKYYFHSIIKLAINNYRYLNKYITNLNSHLFIGDHCRSISSLALIYLSKNYNFNTYLFSHGSHVLNLSNLINSHESLDLAYRMTYHPKIDFIISQSKFCTEFLNSNYPSKKLIYSKPIKWKKKTSMKMNKNNNSINILYAPTIKRLNIRFWMYEDSFELYENLKFLINFTKCNTSVNLIIKMRSNEEFSMALVKDSFHDHERVKFIDSGDITNFFEWSDIVLSYSSTVLEEAMLNYKKIGILSSSNRYFHFPKLQYNKMKEIHYFDYNNFSIKINKLLINQKNNNSNINDYYYENYNEISSLF